MRSVLGSLRELLAGSAHEVAPRLLGATICTREATARLVEVEAYEGANDPGSHAWRGPTPRNRIMWGPPGHLYVYLCYGVHWLVNVVVAPEGEPGAVLLRGIEDDQHRRIEGPGRVSRALGLGARHNGAVLGEEVVIELAEEATGPILATTRIGLSRGGDLPWRFLLEPGEAGGRRRVPACRA